MVKNGIRKKIILNFFIFTAVILAVLWLLQIIFFSTFYAAMKKKILQRTTDTIVEEFIGTENKPHIEELAFKNELSVIIFTINGSEATIKHTAGRGSGAFMTEEVLVEFLEKMGSSSSVNYVTERGESRELTTITYGVTALDKNKEKLYFYVNTSFLPVDSTSLVLQNQLMIVTGLCILLALALSYWMSRRISIPLENLTRSANELALGNLNVSFEANGYGEAQELANTLNYATGEIRKSDKMRKELMANVSHELKTPLTIIKAYAELIRDISGKNELKRLEHLKVILAESDRLTNLVNDILDLSRLEAGVSEYKMDCFNMSVCANRVFSTFANIYTDQGYNFVNLIDDGVLAYGDEERIEQVIFNMVANAVNYSKNNKNITLTLLSTDYGRFRFECQDTGRGIAPDDLKNIFDRFFRTEETKRTTVGSGIGLSLVKTILETHRWQYGAVSKVGEGSTFYIEGGDTLISNKEYALTSKELVEMHGVEAANIIDE